MTVPDRAAVEAAAELRVRLRAFLAWFIEDDDEIPILKTPGDDVLTVGMLRAVLTRNVELEDENAGMQRELAAALDGNKQLQSMNEGLRQMAIEAREAAEGWHRATIDLYSGREEPHPADCPCGRQESCMPQRPTPEASDPPAIAPCCGGPHAGWMRTAECNAPRNPLHARFAHPSWEYATTQGPRKSWDQIDEPPEGDYWERNIDAGRDGWERFDYHEESYWRRLKPLTVPQQVANDGSGT